MLIFSLLLSIASAAEPNCEKIKSYQDFYACSMRRHPKMEIAQLKSKEGDALIDRAAQWKNPDVSVKSTGGTQAGEAIGTTEITFNLPLSQVWTRGPQKSVARAEKRLGEIDSRQSIVDAKKEFIRDIYRLRQIDADVEVITETLDAFDTMRRQLSARRARGPDQEITLNLLQLASSDYLLRRNHLQVEKGEILSRLKALWGSGFEVKKEYLPPLNDKWPQVSEKAEASQNLAVQKAVAEGEKARAESELAMREALPSLSAGPVLERATTGPSQIWSYGVYVSASLPILSLNMGSKRLAEVRAAQASLQSSYEAKRFEFSKDILIQKYRTAVEALSKSSNREEVTKKHHRVDAYFRQGLASGGLVIEAHRQIVEYMQSQHEHENSAIDAYIELMALTGGEIEGILK